MQLYTMHTIGNYTNFWSPARLMKTAVAVESYLKQTSKLVNKKQLEVWSFNDKCSTNRLLFLQIHV